MKQTTPPGYRQALVRLRPALVAVAGLSVIVNLLMLTAPLYMLQIYDRVLTSGSIPTLQGLLVVALMLYTFLGLFDFLRHRLLSRSGYRLDAMLGETAFRRWIAQPPQAGGAKAGGARTDRDGAAPSPAQALNDLETLRGFLGSPAMLALYDLPWIPLYFGCLYLLHPLLCLLTLGGAAVVAVVAGLTHLVTRRATGSAGMLEVEERAMAEQGRRNAELVAALGMEGRLAALWRDRHDRRLGLAQTGAERAEGSTAFSKTFRMFLQSAILSLAAWLVIGQEISSGMIIASSVLSGKALAPIDQILAQWRSIGRARAAHHRLAEALPGTRVQPATDLPAPTGRIDVSNLVKIAPGSSADMTPPRLLDRVSFALEPGDGLGVVGPSASGKSTLARLMVGAWEADAGSLRLDGATIDQWDREILGRHMGYLPQNVTLLPGSIRDNIARFDPWAEDGQVIEAARIAGVHDMILALPQGYATEVGPDSPLSGGQIQRLGLARALFGAPRLIVLDEPNANLDHDGDEALRQAIETMRAKGSTVVVMAHRPSALAAVNKVLVLHEGRVARFGDRDEVLRPAPASSAASTAASNPAAPPATGSGPAARPAARPPVSDRVQAVLAAAGAAGAAPAARLHSLAPSTGAKS